MIPAPDDDTDRAPATLDERVWHLTELVMNAVTDYAVFILDPRGRIRTWNAGAARIKGYLREEIVGQHFSTFYPPEAAAGGVPDFELKVAAEEGRFEDEGWRLRKGGGQFWANVVITALRDGNGILRGFLKITRDLTERRSQEQALKDSEERFRLLVEGVAGHAIYLLDAEGRVMSWNAGAERIKGYRAEEVMGRNFSMFFPPEDVAAGRPQALLDRARLEGRADDEGWRIRHDGTRFWASAVLSRLLDAGGRLRGFAKVTRDLSERRRAESLEEAGRKTNEFLATLSHELRNPLAPIRNAVALMAQRQADRPTLNWARGVIERQTEHLARLVDDLLDISRITLGKVRLDRQNVALTEVVRQAIEVTRPLYEARQHGLDVRHPEDPVCVLGDAIRLAQVVTNLMTNAAKFTPDGGAVTLAVAAEGSEAVLRVRDTGIGIPAEMLNRMFEPFAQGERGLDRTEGGLGVGLTLSRRLVEMHGGTLEAQSAGPGQGSEFVVRLPLFASDTAPAGEARREPAASAGGGRVLVVDDNADSAESTALLLQMWGLEVKIAHDGPEGLRLVGAFRPHCVILDIGLPRMDGLEVARRIRQTPGPGGGVMLIAVTGYGQKEDRDRTRRAGFDHHLTKPVDLEELRALLLGRTPSASASGSPGES